MKNYIMNIANDKNDNQKDSDKRSETDNKKTHQDKK